MFYPRGGLRRLLPGITVVLASNVARAERPVPRLNLLVERDAASEICPDSERILAAGRRLFPAADLQQTPIASSAGIHAEVLIRPTLGGHEAAVHVRGERNGERVLVDRDEECRGLADALAVALALIVDPDAAHAALAARERARPPDPAASAAFASDSPQAPVIDRDGGPSSLGPIERLALDAGALAGVGLLASPAFGGYIGVSATAAGGATLRLRAARLLTSKAEIGAGNVTLDLWGGFVGACYRLPRGERLALSPCLDFGAGAQRAAGRGFTLANHTVWSPFLSLGPSLTGTVGIAAGFEAVLTAGAAANLWREGYVVVEGDGPPGAAEARSLRQPAIGAFVALGVEKAWPDDFRPAR